MKFKISEKKAMLAGVFFTAYIFTRAFRVEQYIGEIPDYIFSTVMLLLILYLILPFSKLITKSKSMYCKSFNK